MIPVMHASTPHHITTLHSTDITPFYKTLPRCTTPLRPMSLKCVHRQTRSAHTFFKGILPLGGGLASPVIALIVLPPWAPGLKGFTPRVLARENGQVRIHQAIRFSRVDVLLHHPVPHLRRMPPVSPLETPNVAASPHYMQYGHCRKH